MIFNLTAGGGKTTITYSGTHTTESYTADGKAYTLYKITGSGTLTVKGRAKGVDIWLCGGGANGTAGGAGGAGGAGAYCAQASNQKLKGTYTISVGSAQGKTSFGDLLSVNAVSGKNGGTGGGGGGKGDGLSKYPFGDSITYKCHCAGGGGGESVEHTSMGSPTTSYVGSGGSNGLAGGYGNGTAGGTYGGGNGGYASAGPSESPSGYKGYAASFYGGGGGGGGYAHDMWSGNATGAGGAGYQGVVYIRVPA